MEMLEIIKKSWIETELNFFIDSEQKINTKTGVFLNPATGAVWEVFIEEGKVLVDVPNFRFQIFPRGHTRFKPVHTQIHLEFEFEEPRQNQPLLLHIYAKGIKRATFVALY